MWFYQCLGLLSFVISYTSAIQKVELRSQRSEDGTPVALPQQINEPPQDDLSPPQIVHKHTVHIVIPLLADGTFSTLDVNPGVATGIRSRADSSTDSEKITISSGSGDSHFPIALNRNLQDDNSFISRSELFDLTYPRSIANHGPALPFGVTHDTFRPKETLSNNYPEWVVDRFTIPPRKIGITIPSSYVGYLDNVDLPSAFSERLLFPHKVRQVSPLVRNRSDTQKSTIIDSFLDQNKFVVDKARKDSVKSSKEVSLLDQASDLQSVTLNLTEKFIEDKGGLFQQEDLDQNSINDNIQDIPLVPLPETHFHSDKQGVDVLPQIDFHVVQPFHHHEFKSPEGTAHIKSATYVSQFRHPLFRGSTPHKAVSPEEESNDYQPSYVEENKIQLSDFKETPEVVTLHNEDDYYDYEDLSRYYSGYEQDEYNYDSYEDMYQTQNKLPNEVSAKSDSDDIVGQVENEIDNSIEEETTTSREYDASATGDDLEHEIMVVENIETSENVQNAYDENVHSNKNETLTEAITSNLSDDSIDGLSSDVITEALGTTTDEEVIPSSKTPVYFEPRNSQTAFSSKDLEMMLQKEFEKLLAFRHTSTNTYKPGSGDVLNLGSNNHVYNDASSLPEDHHYAGPTLGSVEPIISTDHSHPHQPPLDYGARIPGYKKKNANQIAQDEHSMYGIPSRPNTHSVSNDNSYHRNNLHLAGPNIVAGYDQDSLFKELKDLPNNRNLNHEQNLYRNDYSPNDGVIREAHRLGTISHYNEVNKDTFHTNGVISEPKATLDSTNSVFHSNEVDVLQHKVDQSGSDVTEDHPSDENLADNPEDDEESFPDLLLPFVESTSDSHLNGTHPSIGEFSLGFKTLEEDVSQVKV